MLFSHAPMKSEAMSNRRRIRQTIGAVAILGLAFIVYLPVVPGSFLMDDARLVGGDNPLVNGHLTPLTLWFRTDFTLATFGWWLEHLVFGANPAGYHVVNIALHAISSILLWRLLARLGVPGAWLAGVLYAVHPVCVNSVARIAELKNTLSMPFFLLSFIAYLRYEAARLYPNDSHRNGRSPCGATLCYVISLVAFVLAIMAKTTAVMLPPVLLLCALWQRGRIAVKDVLHTFPFFVLSAGFGLMSVWFQKHQALPLAEFALHRVSFAERLTAAGFDFWFYVGKDLLPVHLSIQYPRWNIDPRAVAAWWPDVFVGVVFGACVLFYRQWGRHVLFGLGCFAVMLFPALGFFDAEFLTLWQVSDHLQYSALAAVVALMAAGLAQLPNRIVFPCVSLVAIFAAAVLCFQRADAFRTQESIMADTVAGSPSAWDADNDLGVVYAQKKEYAKAIDEFTLSLKYNPDDGNARLNLGRALGLEGKFAAAEAQFQMLLEAQPYAADANQAYATLLERERKNSEALRHLKIAAIFNPAFETYMDLAGLEYTMGHSRDAVAHYRNALAFKADANADNNLAWILATSPDDSLRDGTEAVWCAEQACDLTDYKQPAMLGTLAAAYAEAGRFREAIETGEKAAQLARAMGYVQLAKANEQLLMFYRAGKPYHEQAIAQ